jgi:hypothetical protein
MSLPNIGDRVLNRHRQSCDLPQHIRDSHRGTVTEVIPGCNPLVRVRFDGRDHASIMAPQDLAYCDTWPAPKATGE